jgi:hypothetical protein
MLAEAALRYTLSSAAVKTIIPSIASTSDVEGQRDLLRRRAVPH